MDKLLKQSQRFRPDELVSIQRRIAELDQAIETGQIRGALGLELLVLEICRRPESEEVRPTRAASRSVVRTAHTRLR